MVATERARERARERTRQRKRERAQCRPPFCTCVRAAFPTHSGNILLTLSAHNFHTQNLLTCPRGGASGGGGAGRVGFVSVTWHCFPSLSLSPSLPLFLEYPEKHTQADASSTSPPPALPRAWLCLARVLLEKEVGARRVYTRLCVSMRACACASV